MQGDVLFDGALELLKCHSVMISPGGNAFCTFLSGVVYIILG
jgi:hypothetical protein